jgi:hypothetical protein
LTADVQDQSFYPQPDRCSATKGKQIGRTVETAGLFSESKTYATSQQPNCASAVEAKAGYSQQENRFKLRRPAALDLLNGREIVRHTNHLLRPIAVTAPELMHPPTATATGVKGHLVSRS